MNELSATVCELLEWKQPSGRLKVHEGRQLLDRLRQQGLVRVAFRRQLALPGAFGAVSRASAGLPAVVFNGLGDGGGRPLDWLDPPATRPKPSLVNFGHCFRDPEAALPGILP